MRTLSLLVVAFLACGRTAPLGGDPMSQQSVLLQASGLYTLANDIDGTPPGALAIAENVVIDREDVIESRPGFPPYTATFGTGTSRARKLYWWNGVLVAHFDTSLAYYNGSAWVTFSGTFAYPDTLIRPPAVVAEQEFFISTAAGVLANDALANTFVAAGVPKALDGQAAATTIAGTALLPNAQVAYRHLWGKRNAFNRLKLGSPSGRTVISNPAGQIAAIGGAVRVGTTVTVTTPAAHGFVTGQVVTQTGSEANFAAGNKTITATGTTTTFTYTEAGTATSSTVALTYTPVTTDVNYTARIPNGITTSHFLQVYRTANSPTVNDDPGDNEQLVYEYTPSNVDIAAGAITVKDIAPDIVRGAQIYTSPDAVQGTVAFQNDPPPLARAMAQFKGSTFYGNINSLPTLTVALLAINDTTGLSSFYDSVISVRDQSGPSAGVTVTSSTVEGAGIFVVSASGTAAQNIARTAQSIVRAVNSAVGNTYVSAAYVSGPDDPPGRIAFTALKTTSTSLGMILQGAPSTAFSPNPPAQFSTSALNRVSNVTTVTTVRPTGFVVGQQFHLTAGGSFPTGTYTVTVVTDSTHFKYADVAANASGTGTSVETRDLSVFANWLQSNGTTAQKNGLAWSKPGQPDAVPPIYQKTIGAADKGILAMVPLRDSLFVLKEDGVFRVTGDAGQFTVEDYDRTLRVLCGESAVALENQVWALSDQGVVAMSEHGSPRVMSRPIEDKLPRNYSTNLSAYGFAIGHESKRRYMLFTELNGTTPSGAYVYNAFTNAWTHWTLSRTAGVVDPVADNLYLAQGTAPFPGVGSLAGVANLVTRDTKAGNALDFYDSTQGAFNVDTHLASNQLLFASSVDAAVGDVLVDVQTNAPARVIARSGSAGNLTLTMDRDVSAFDASGFGVTFYGGFSCDVQWTPQTGGNPGQLKQYFQADFLFRQAAFTGGAVVFTTDFVSAQSTTVPGTSDISATASVAPITVWLPQEAQMATQMRPEFQLTCALGAFQLEGIALRWNAMSGNRR